ncbi:hypothetical protein BJY52DRAFT_1302903 [Lactarius psammicola]|nr:hypothetical protein BJY52DRAFT_1302903 [Lactarius psammicola]
MEPSNRTGEQRSGMRNDNTSTGGQWDNPVSKGSQGKWEHREGELFSQSCGWVAVHRCAHYFSPRLNGRCSLGLLLITSSLDNTGGQGGDTYTPQYLGQSSYDEYGTNTVGAGTGPGGVNTQSDRYAASGQYSDATSQTAGYADPTRNVAGGDRRPEDDEDNGGAVGAGGAPTGKPSMTSRVKGAAEKMAGKIMGDPGKQARGREREEGTL